ncbi:ionotropic receptor 40a-like [Battus philenor]|uniref:ionotropic receptor 40a-like n=1 Tax=Battus philenor TaxID=42288 RepID=UPI0035D132C0
MNLIIVTFSCLTLCNGFLNIINVITPDSLTNLPKDFSIAISNIVQGIPTKALTVVRGNSTNIRSRDMVKLICLLNENNIQIINLDLTSQDYKAIYFSFLKEGLDNSEERISLILCQPVECENLILELTEHNLIHRSILYIFYWPIGEPSIKFQRTMKDAMRVAVITNPRDGVFRIYYNQATPNRLHHLSLVNWWSGKLYRSPVLPPANLVYKNFQGRMFDVPVLHAPPWHFVKYYNNSTVEVTGGRDDKLLSLIAKRLNFRYQYYDPPDRSQGSSISGNGTFKGTLGLIWKRKADFFIGDVTVTWERLQAVEFSFVTLADSGAFLTHAPAKLSETLAIIRPFRWEVWPYVFATLMITGPALWVVIAAPYFWQRRRQNHLDLFNDCCWFTTTLFLRQSSSKEPSSTHKARLVSVLISLGATYVIGDMYSANLTSLLARPAREQPIGTLEALEEAMRDRKYELVVERHSSSLTILENGTGVYGRLAKLMRHQKIQRVRSIEVGVRLILAHKRIAVLGGRETLYYDTERFGSHNFHLSEKLYTRYSAIALQIGCPYLETFNSVIMNLFEAGILAKVTKDEYKNLPEQSRRSEPVTESDKESTDISGDSITGSQMQSESSIGLEPVSLVMLRGAFCLLGAGYLLAALALIVEIHVNRRSQTSATTTDVSSTNNLSKLRSMGKIKNSIRQGFRKILRSIYDNIDRAFGPE